ncbi:MAG: SPOR domain-containing protein [Desulfotignum sp.]|jgi:cell division protein FtsN|nr:SPOR domain-containing protein [Desulfotignum sp.]
MSFKGAIKYTIYICIGGWMFLLGIMVGRGTAPVTFETQGFQERLLEIAKKTGNKENPKKQETKIALHYYEALSEPVKPEELPMMPPGATMGMLEEKSVDAQQMQPEPADMQETPAEIQKMQPDAIPVKTSKKAATFNKAATAKIADGPETKQETARPGKTKTPEKTDPELAAGAGTGSGSDGVYTIQVAAFKSFKDAVTQAAVLDEKGFAATRTSKAIDGVTWYRVRIGGFATREAAHRQLEKLNQAGINGMIIKKE